MTIGRGVFIIKSYFGYDVMVDNTPLKIDVSWSEADFIAEKIAKGRPAGDGRGWGRCKCIGDTCFNNWKCLKVED